MKSGIDTVGAAVREARRRVDFIDVYCLLGAVLKRNKEFLLTHPEHEISGNEARRLERYVKRRVEGEPVAYITGVKEFYGLTFEVSHHTLIPRPETEMLVDEVVRLKPDTLLDMGTGSGCIAVSAASLLSGCSVTAVDISRRALATAGGNARRLLECRTVRFVKSVYFKKVPAGVYDVIVSNPPYVRSADLEGRVSYEPASALDGGEDGLDAYRVILSSAGSYLNGGALVLEISPELRAGVEELAGKYGFSVCGVFRDLAGLDRMAVLR